MRHFASILFVVALIGLSVNGKAEPLGSVKQLDWLVGCWDGNQGEECWLGEKGGGMIGVNRSADGSRFELLRIVTEEAGDIVYLASPQGQSPPTPFQASSIGDQRVVFSNPTHDFPQRIEYWVDGEAMLRARVSAVVDGEEEGFEISWHRRGWTRR